MTTSTTETPRSPILGTNETTSMFSYFTYGKLTEYWFNKDGKELIDILKDLNNYGATIEMSFSTVDSDNTQKVRYFGSSIMFYIWEKDYVEATSVSEETE